MSFSSHSLQRRFLSCLMLAGWLPLAAVASAAPLAITGLDDPGCDVLDAPPSVVEIGFGPAVGGPFPLLESLDALDLGNGDPVCPATNDPFLENAVVAILNTSGQSFSDVWYVADAATTLSNVDGRIGEGAGPATLLTFKIDAVGDNQPLVFESFDEDGIWEPGEVWYFVIQDFENSSGASPAAFGSVGLDSVAGISSSASIITEAITSSIVTTLADSGPGSLRQIIADVAAGTTITFDAGLNGGTITLGGTQLLVDKTLTINASALAGGITIDANDTSRVFAITAGNTVAMHNLIITGGRATVTVAVPNPWGGGIYSFGSLTLNKVTVTDCSASSGGGVFNESGMMEILSSTISGNSITSNGSGIYTYRGSVTLTNSTLSGNTAGAGAGGIYCNETDLTLRHVTIADNSSADGGGIVNLSGTLNLENTIVAGNTAPTNANLSGPFIGTGGNIITSGDRFLAPLANYGGPTRTMPPLPGSPAIEGAVMLAGTPTTDQRGAARPSGPLPDIGAVEAFPFSNLALVDSDFDGIDDRIEAAYPQFTVGVDDSALDSDGDGSTDAEELANMTNPNDANDKLKILSFGKAAGFDPVANPVFDVTIATFPGLSYELETSETLEDFQLVPGSSFTADDFTSVFEVQLTPNRGFLRARRN